ncbi:transmembrane protein 244 [Erpetoichthys calabaricus]|uniref:transmembrane protein 244 n=1 Tax=Erpetoichthys calabaricus TaxID=27687 RepID=UPI0022342F2B|nr:transmembrane protein 244 [Erpetoichthys calabaricus]
MAIKIKIGDTRTILLNLLACVLTFYTVYYVTVSLCIWAFRLEEKECLLTPFDFKTIPSWTNPEYLVNLISLEVSYAVSGLLFVWIVEEWVWDYAITITLFHIGLTTAVMSDFPAAVHWWIALGSGLSVMIIGGQLLAYKLYKNNFIYPVLEDF